MGPFYTLNSTDRCIMYSVHTPRSYSLYLLIYRTVTVVNSSIWLNVEANIGILSACLPTLQPLFRKHIVSAIRLRFSKHSSNRYGTGSQRLSDVERKPRSGVNGAKTLTRERSMGPGITLLCWRKRARPMRCPTVAWRR